MTRNDIVGARQLVALELACIGSLSAGSLFEDCSSIASRVEAERVIHRLHRRGMLKANRLTQRGIDALYDAHARLQREGEQ